MSPGSMRHIKYRAAWCHRSDRTVPDTVGKMGTGEVKILLHDHSHFSSALVTERGRGEGGKRGRAIVLYNEGWEHILVDGKC